jgi:lipid-A-disaccharide synthase
VSFKILVSAGEASGDLYAARLVEALRKREPAAEFFGCAGHHMQRAGVRPIVDASRLAVVGLVEVAAHIPRIYGDYRRLLEAAGRERPDVAILTDSPDFHLRLAPRLRRLGIPVVYLVAPQVWAWRKRRIHAIRRNINRLLCIFPFEESFFRRHGVAADYIGHPLALLVRPGLSRAEFFRKHRLPDDRPLVTLLPGSRRGEILRHLPPLLEAAGALYGQQAISFVLALPAGLPAGPEIREQAASAPVLTMEGETWDAIAHADLALAASGTVTVEAALLGTPMITFYKVTGLSWLMGRFLVDVPFYSMVNLIAGRPVVPELMQNEMTGVRLAAEAGRLLADSEARWRMALDLRDAAAGLVTGADPMERAAGIVQQVLASRSVT